VVHDMSGMIGLADYGNNLDAAISQLMAKFPGVANYLSWKEAIFSAQIKYRSAAPELADHQLYVATCWLRLANEDCLEVKMDLSRGLIVREVLRDNSPQPALAKNVIRIHLRKLFFKKLSELPDGRLLQIFEVMRAFQHDTGESLENYKTEFEAVVDELCNHSYMRHQQKGGQGMSLFCKGIEFDKWSADMTAKVAEPAGHTFNFNAAVGSVQTGSHSVSHVQQSFDQSQLAGLKDALEAVLAEFAKANLPADAREEAQGLIESVIVEIDKPKPNKLSLRSLLAGIATTVQTLGSASDAYKAFAAAIALIGIPLP